MFSTPFSSKLKVKNDDPRSYNDTESFTISSRSIVNTASYAIVNYIYRYRHIYTYSPDAYALPQLCQRIMLKTEHVYTISQLTIFPLPPPLKSGYIGIRDVQCTETYDFFFLQILCFFFWDMVDFLLKISRKFNKKSLCVPNDVQCSETYAKLVFHFLQLLFFEIWSILYSKFLVNWGL